MSRHAVQAPSLVVNSAAPLTKDQKAFNALISKIDAKRLRLAEWERAIPVFSQKYLADLLPLQQKHIELCAQLARKLDAAHAHKGVTRAERRKLSIMIVDLALRVLDDEEQQDIKALYNRHSQSDFDAEQEQDRDAMKAMFASVLDIDLSNEEGLDSRQDILARARERLQAQQDAQPAAEPPQKPSAKQQAREARREAEKKQISQSLREVYRKLASALHPDREPDETERHKKTGLMQRVNDAYERGNLLQLLELQLQLEHIDPTHLANLAPERLKHYIKILRGQLEELDIEILRIEHDFAARFGLPPCQTPQASLSRLNADVNQCKAGIRQVQAELKIAGNVPQLKAWLKHIAVHRQAPDFDL